MATSLLGALPTGQAARILGLTSRAQLDKLIGCGLIPVVSTTPGGQRRVDSTAVLNLAARPRVADGPRDGGPDLALHLGPLQADGNGTANQRTHAGFHTDPASLGVSAQQARDAWVGLWNCDPSPYLGGALVGDVSGFVVVVAQITGYQIINRLVRFEITDATDAMTAHYLGHRITARPGAPFQTL